ncbi:MAG: methyl-accepting chemotaxis protein [Eubacterium sp.]
MKIKKKIVLLAIGPLILLGIVSMALTLTMMRGSMLDEIKEALKGTAAATLAAYDQNTGEYKQTTNGDVWKGSYNVSKSDELVDRIKKNTGMDVTFFYGKTRIMTSAKDNNGERVLQSEAGETIVKQVLQGKKEYFSKAVSIEGTLNYGYYMPVYQENSDSDVVGMVFVGTNKQQKDAIINQMLITIAIAVGCIMLVCIAIAMKLASTMSKNINASVHLVRTIADGNLDVKVKKKLLKQKDEIGDLSRATVALRDAMENIILEISDNAKSLMAASKLLEQAAEDTGYTMNNVRKAVDTVVHNSEEQAENSRDTSIHMQEMGDTITKASTEVEKLNETAALMQNSSEKAAVTIEELCSINEQVEAMIKNVQAQTDQTNASVQKIQKATAFIASVAEETNLLSLNASIEAARAGESGRGFAVVANQIKTLSEQSNASSEEIKTTAKQLYNDSQRAVESMQQMRETITSQSASMEATQRVLQEVMREIAESMQRMSQMKKSTVELEGVRNEILASMDTLSEFAQNNLESTKQTYEQTNEVADTFEKVNSNAEELRTIAEKLADSIRYFRVS